MKLEAAELFPERSSHRFSAECTRLELSMHSAVCVPAHNVQLKKIITFYRRASEAKRSEAKRRYCFHPRLSLCLFVC